MDYKKIEKKYLIQKMELVTLVTNIYIYIFCMINIYKKSYILKYKKNYYYFDNI